MENAKKILNKNDLFFGKKKIYIGNNIKFHLGSSFEKCLVQST